MWITRLNPGFLVFFMLTWAISFFPALVLGGAKFEGTSANLYLCFLWSIWLTVFASPYLSERARDLILKPDVSKQESFSILGPFIAMFSVFLVFAIYGVIGSQDVTL